MKRTKQTLALLLCLVLCLSLFPAAALAGEPAPVGDGVLDVPESIDNPSVSHTADSSPYTGEPVIAVAPPEAVADDAANASGSVVASGTCGKQGNNPPGRCTTTVSLSSPEAVRWQTITLMRPLGTVNAQIYRLSR